MSDTIRNGLVAFLVVLAVLSGTAGVAAAETRFDDTIVIGPDETVEGDLDAFASTVVVRGTVTGDLNAFASNVVIAGTVEGDVNAFGATVELAEGGVVSGGFNAFASDVAVAGRIGGDAVVGAETIRLAETATIGGDLRYDGTLIDRGAAVDGQIVRDDSLVDVGITPDLGAVGVVYGLLVAFLLGAVLLVVFPDVSERVAATGVTDPLLSGGVGLLTLVGVPIVLVVIAITIVGIPFSLIGLLLYLLGLWIGSVYGRFVVGSWLLSLADYENRWLALVVGLLLYWLVGYVPLVGGLVQLLFLLLGLGALVLVAYRRYRGRDAVPPAEEEDADSGAPAT